MYEDDLIAHLMPALGLNIDNNVEIKKGDLVIENNHVDTSSTKVYWIH